MKKMNNSRVALNVAKNLACASLLAFAACSVYDNYSEDAYNEYYGIGVAVNPTSSSDDASSSSIEGKTSSSSEKAESGSDESLSSIGGDVSSSSNGSTATSSSSETGSATSSSNDTGTASSSSIVSVSSSSAEVASSSSEVASSSSVTPVNKLRCGLDGLEDNRVEAVTSKYKTVKIGTQCWIAKNVDAAFEGSSCYDESTCETYGRLYPGNMASYVCPDGSHLPTPEEFDTLIKASSGDVVAGKFLKAKDGWSEYSGTNAVGFDALPAGFINDDEESVMFGERGYFWTDSTVDGGMIAYYLTNDDQMFQSEVKSTEFMLSIRCVVDSGTWK